MKTFYRSLLLSSITLCSAATLAWAAAPTMDVKITNSAGKVVFKGKTGADGQFTTKSVAPGSYVVQFNADSAKGGPFGLVVKAGKNIATAESVPGGKFTKGGVAMKLQVAEATSLVGEVGRAGHLALGNKTPAAETKTAGNTQSAGESRGATKSGVKTKMVDGKKYIWMEGLVGSGYGGHWAPADSKEAQNKEKAGSNVDF